MNHRPKVLVLGATGMLGNAVLRYFAQRGQFDVMGSARSSASVRRLPEPVRGYLLSDVAVDNTDSLIKAFARARPHVVINCIGLVKQLQQAEDPLEAIPINAVLPHRLAAVCEAVGARLVHVSTDCVFAGTRGMYAEGDTPDASDLYGRSKLLGEVDRPNAVTLRTSIIGHELGSAHGLVEWFLSQHGAVSGFTRAFFSGLPTVELARVIHDFVLPNEDLHGLYHVSAARIDKCSLLRLIGHAYARPTDIVPDDKVAIDRSLDGTRFCVATGYASPEWPALVEAMHHFG